MPLRDNQIVWFNQTVNIVQENFRRVKHQKYVTIISVYKFSWLWFFVGIIVTLGGIAFLRFYKEIADNMGNGVSSYDRYKLVAFGLCATGILMMFNLHNLVIAFIARLIFGGAIG
ncbi:hypothetical protein FWH58_02585 [Candidatus Saccharibacteria bacterium]|nr:hypothetical protein [Candidatus Saccharibacteria bacterium]